MPRPPSLGKCRRIAAGHETSFAISDDGVLFAFGSARGGAAIGRGGGESARVEAAEDSKVRAVTNLSECLEAVFAGSAEGWIGKGTRERGSGGVRAAAAAGRADDLREPRECSAPLRLRFADVDAGVFHAAAITDITTTTNTTATITNNVLLLPLLYYYYYYLLLLQTTTNATNTTAAAHLGQLL